MKPNEDTKEDRELLTAKEAAQAFMDAGLSEPTFRRRVNAGQIETIMPEGRKRGALYPKDQVIAAIGTKDKKPKRSKKNPSNLTPTTFSRATVKDMPEMAILLETFYKAKISVEKRAGWIERNPEIAYTLRTENELVGCAFIMPLAEEKIFQILETQVKPPTRPHEIPLYEAGKHYNLYVRAVGVLQSVSKELRRHWAAKLITGIAEATTELGAKGIYIDHIYAQGDTKAGERALKMIGFMQIETNAPTTRKNFMLDVIKSGSVFAMKYKHALNTWRAQNEEE